MPRKGSVKDRRAHLKPASAPGKGRPGRKKHSDADETVLDPRFGKVSDYISDRPVVAGKEELEAVQVFSKILVEDYGYPKTHVQTRPQWRVKARPSDTSKEYPVDIAVFSGPSHTDGTLQLVVECKQRTRKDGVTQLEDYMRLSKAELGVWFNGEETQYLRKVERGGRVLFEHIPSIPRFGQRLEDIGRFKRKDLRSPHNLKRLFQIIRNHLAGNAGSTTRDEELARQLINLVFCKIYDEKFTDLEAAVEFRAGVDEPNDKVRGRIESIFKKVKQKYAEVIDVGEKIELDDKSIVYVVGQLQDFCIIDAQRDVVADAFETFIAGALKGGQGQFFTPRNVARLMVQIAAPTDKDLIIDPACGSGGFLVESLRHVWRELEKKGWPKSAIEDEKHAVAVRNFNGIEKDDFLSKVAKAYMAILGDGKGGIFCDDSLEPVGEWKAKTQQHVALGKYDLVLSNPPFGKDIKITGEKKLRQFDLAHRWTEEDGIFIKGSKCKDEMPPDVLFIERCLQLLKKGGRLGIVLPETFFHAPSGRYVMQFLRQHNIFFVLDLPHNTFRPHNNAKCIVVFVQKGEKQQKRIRMAVAEEMGHDHTGKEIFRWDPVRSAVDKSKIWDDIPAIAEEISGRQERHFTFEVDAKTCEEHGVWVPRYYWQEKEVELLKEARRRGFDLVPVSQLIEEGVLEHFDGHGSPASENKGNGDVPYIRVKDIVNWDVYKDPTSKIPLHVYEAMARENKALQERDILYVKRGSYRIGSVAMVSPFDKQVLLTREILVLRTKPKNRYSLTPFYLLFALSHRFVQDQTTNKVLIETTLPNIGDRWQQLKVPIPKDPAVLASISAKVQKIFEKKWGAQGEIQAIREEFGDLTT
jgi:type I restriction enzyme M protein